MAKKQAQREQESMVASLNPDDMLSGGLKDDFRGTIVEAVYAPWDYDGNIEEPVLAGRLTIQPHPDEEDQEPYTQHWSAGDLAAFVPSQDGKTPTDGEGMEMEPGPYAIRVGKRAQLNNNTNFAHLIQSIIDSGEASKKFSRSDLTASLQCLEGLDAQWNRVPQKKRAGLPGAEEGEGRRSRDVLVVSEVFGYGEEAQSSSKGKSSGKSAQSSTKGSTKAAAKAADNGGTDDLDEEMQGAILEKLADGPVKRGTLATLMLKTFASEKAKKSAAVKRCTQADFLENGPWLYDEDSGTLNELEED